jgi:hypothetical protein
MHFTLYTVARLVTTSYWIEKLGKNSFFSARVGTTLFTSLCSGKVDKKGHLTPINQ